jgi:hypothetical protein
MSKHICPVCEKYEFETGGEWDLCPVCGWTDDPLESASLDYGGGYNGISVNDAREKFASGKKIYED